ncbi:MAG TPA: ATP-binding cassette domain-containing protein [Syntrophomonadaceae bacterium]|nr:ATP-binding cassette domain-containing protein [Syntrophomonadaceae bacterium]
MLKLEDIWMQVESENGENREILRGINLEFNTGKLYGITGPNGGGKTSLAKVIMGIYKHTKGRIFLNGEDISHLSITERAQRGIGYGFQQPPRFKGLTIGDMLAIAAPDADPKRRRLQLRAVGLCPEDYLDRDLGPGLSGGEMKRIEMAQLLLRDCKVSIFDEPEAGVDLWTIQKLIALIEGGYKHNPDKVAIIISHNENILPICDEIIVLEDGMVTDRGTANQVWHLIRDDIECKVRTRCQGDLEYEIDQY